MKELILRKAVEADIEAISELEEICFPDPWSKESIKEEILNNEKALWIVAELMEDTPKVVGYIGIWQIFDEGHIMNVAVNPAYRGHHIGYDIMETMINVTQKMGITRWTLEVRASNTVAHNLYRKFGFKDAGIRKGYYLNNHEDAIIMWKLQETELN